MQLIFWVAGNTRGNTGNVTIKTIEKKIGLDVPLIETDRTHQIGWKSVSWLLFNLLDTSFDVTFSQKVLQGKIAA